MIRTQLKDGMQVYTYRTVTDGFSTVVRDLKNTEILYLGNNSTLEKASELHTMAARFLSFDFN